VNAGACYVAAMDLAIHDADTPRIEDVLLHDYWRSSAAYRVRIGLALKGIAYRAHAVDLAAGAQRDPAYRAANPQGFVPMLEMDGLRLTQSLAILHYLDARHPMPPFLPVEPAARAHVEALALTIACDIHPLNNLRVLNHLRDDWNADEAARTAWVRCWVAEGFAALEALAAPQAGTHLHGDAPSLADILLVPQMYNARRFGVPLELYPTLVRADATAQAHPAFAAVHPDKVRPFQ